MNINFTANLKRQDIEDILKAHVEKALPGYTVLTITFNTPEQRDMRGESCGSYLVSADIQLKPR